MTKKESRLILFSITLCWASSYIFIKDVPPDFSSYAYLALTSGTAGIILAIVFRRLFRLMNRVFSIFQDCCLCVSGKGIPQAPQGEERQ